MFTHVIANMYEADQQHKIEDPMEHILKELGITPPRKQQYLLTEDQDPDLLKQEHDDLRLAVLQLEHQADELEAQLFTLRNTKKVSKTSSRASLKSSAAKSNQTSAAKI